MISRSSRCEWVQAIINCFQQMNYWRWRLGANLEFTQVLFGESLDLSLGLVQSFDRAPYPWPLHSSQARWVSIPQLCAANHWSRQCADGSHRSGHEVDLRHAGAIQLARWQVSAADDEAGLLPWDRRRAVLVHPGQHQRRGTEEKERAHLGRQRIAWISGQERIHRTCRR